MMMEFCQKCGTRLRIKQIREGDNIFHGLACDKCGFYVKVKNAVARPSSESVSSIKVFGDEANDIKTMPTTSIECQKCGNTTAYWWFLQTRSGDEPPTQFYRCTNGKCNHTWRAYI